MREIQIELVKSNERVDDLQYKGLKIIQDPEKFCFGMDAVLLAGFARIKPRDMVADFGTGTGILPILCSAKNETATFKALEIQEASVDMASRSVSLNHLEQRIEIIHADIKDASSRLGASSCNVVTCNPPYMIGGHGIQNPKDELTIARHEVLCTLEDIIKQASLVLKHGGRFYMVHRPFRLPEIMSLMVKYHLEPKRMRLVYPHENKEPNMVLIEGMLGAKPRLTVEPPLIVYNQDGTYTDEIYEIYHMIPPKREERN